MSAEVVLSGEEQVTELADRVWARLLERDLYVQLRQGAPVSSLPGLTLDETEQEESFAQGVLAALDDVDEADLPVDSLLTARVIRDQMRRRIADAHFYWHDVPVTPYSWFLLWNHRNRALTTARFDSAEDCDRYVSLVADVAAILHQITDKVAEQARRGLRVPRPALGGVVGLLTAARDRAAADYAVGPERLISVAPRAAASFNDAVSRLVREAIRPQYGRLLELLGDAYAEAAPDAVGLSHQEGGGEYYRHLVTTHTTLDLEPEQIHRIGEEQVTALTEEMAAVRASTGFGGTEEEFHGRIHEDRRLHAASAAELEARLLWHVHRAEELLDRYFPVLPKAPYRVERLHPALEASMSFGYYERPTRDDPVGRYRYNGAKPAERPMILAATLIFHELVPGHHLQIARQQENEALHPLRRDGVSYTAFSEGWAEYAAGLGGEMGLYDDPYDRYGRLLHERMMAARLVADTGLNEMGWTLERAAQTMSRLTLESPAYVMNEVLRYGSDMPAQALCYRLGWRAFNEARQTALGLPLFDLRRFHETVLSQGSLPLRDLSDALTGRLWPNRISSRKVMQMRLTSGGRDASAPWLRRWGVAVALVAASCTTEGAFRQDRRLTILSPRSGDTVELPVVVRWSAKDFAVTGLDGSERDDAGLFAVFVDRAPVRPGRNLSDLASDDTSCEQTPGCPDDAWFAERGVYRTEQNGLELASLVDTRPSGRRDAKDSHEVTVILVNGRGERIGESGATRQFFVNRVRRP